MTGKASLRWFGLGFSALAFAVLLAGGWAQQGDDTRSLHPTNRESANGGFGLTRVPGWAWGVATATLLFWRRPETWLYPQFWAEDGNFYQEAYTQGWRAFVQPYAGYHHLLPRLIGELSTWFSPFHAPLISVTTAGLAPLLVAWATQWARSPWHRQPWAALAVVAVPDVGETLGSIANLQFTIGAAFCLLLTFDDASTRRSRVGEYTFAVIGGLTGPFSLILWPCFAWRALRRRSRHSILLAGLLGLCAGLQAISLLLTSKATDAAEPMTAVAALSVLGARVGGSLFLGSWLPAAPAAGLWWALGGLATLAAGAGLALQTGGGRLRRLWLAAAVGALLVACLYRSRDVLPSMLHVGFGARYFYVPQLVALWFLITSTHGSRQWLRITARLLLGWFVLANAPRLREPALPRRDWAEQASKIEAGSTDRIPTNPEGWTLPPFHRPSHD